MYMEHNITGPCLCGGVAPATLRFFDLRPNSIDGGHPWNSPLISQSTLALARYSGCSSAVSLPSAQADINSIYKHSFAYVVLTSETRLYNQNSKNITKIIVILLDFVSRFKAPLHWI